MFAERMNTYRQVFHTRHTVLPVIHSESLDQTLRNAEMAYTARCPGVFLINHEMGYRDLLIIHQAVCRRFPKWWVGVNCLDLSPTEVFQRVSQEVAGIWVDNSLIDERNEKQPLADMVAEAREGSGWHGLYFGGVAFKYQRPVADLAGAARIAANYMNVITSSGPGTGMAAYPEKFEAMKRAIGDTPLAIASGITPENVHEYLGVADCFLVATGISKSFTELEPMKLQALINAVAMGKTRKSAVN